MATVTQPSQGGDESFAALLDESLKRSTGFDGTVATGRVISI